MIFFLLVAIVNAQPLVAVEFAALMEIFDATGCRNIACPRFKANEPCPGGRILCEEGHVTQLMLDNTSTTLTGTLPASLNALTHLTRFECQLNALTGTIPDLQALTRLTMAWFQVNRFSGTIHSTFNLLTALTTLSFRDNSVSGPLPSFAALSQLKLLRFDNTQVTGKLDVPAANLNECDLSSTCLTCSQVPSQCMCTRRSFCPATSAPTAAPTPAPTPEPPAAVTTTALVAPTPPLSTSPPSETNSTAATAAVSLTFAASTAAATPPPPESDNTGLIVGVIVAALLLAAGATATLVWLDRRRRKPQEQQPTPPQYQQLPLKPIYSVGNIQQPELDSARE